MDSRSPEVPPTSGSGNDMAHVQPGAWETIGVKLLGLPSKIVVDHSNDVRRWSEASGLFANPVERGSVQEFLDWGLTC